jgi:prepilin-type N-terminal cleavage/methylation domain-containing protein
MRVVYASTAGFSLIEVMVSMVVLAFGLLGAMATLQWSERALQFGSLGAVALSLAESRLEAKRGAAWRSLLEDDLNADGLVDVRMHDDGMNGDEVAGDGIFTAAHEEGPVRLTWTVEPDRAGALESAGAAVIQVRARYAVGNQAVREIRVGTVRANPGYVGL